MSKPMPIAKTAAGTQNWLSVNIAFASDTLESIFSSDLKAEA
jgi:hypothetical protein